MTIIAYNDLHGRPWQSCPMCGEEWTHRGGVILVTKTGGHVLQHNSSLDSCGTLTDVDRLVANGYYHGAICAGCEIPFSEIPHVVEVVRNV